MIVVLWSFLITIAVVGAYLIGVEVGEARRRIQRVEYENAFHRIEELEARLEIYDEWIRQRFARGEA